MGVAANSESLFSAHRYRFGKAPELFLQSWDIFWKKLGSFFLKTRVFWLKSIGLFFSKHGRFFKRPLHAFFIRL